MDSTCKAVIDNNVILDYFLERSEFIKSADNIMQLIHSGRLTGLISSNSITDIYYFLKKNFGHQKALNCIEIIDNKIKIITVSRNDIMNSMLLDFNDLEDALVSYCAEREKADYIITRNEKDFLESRVEAISPEEFLKNKVV